MSAIPIKTRTLLLSLSLLVLAINPLLWGKNVVWSHGAVIRGDTTQPHIALVFSAHEFNEGGWTIYRTLQEKQIRGSFFFTGKFYSDTSNVRLVRALQKDGHYLGSHSFAHLLYCDWTNRDSTLVSHQEFKSDMLMNFQLMDSLYGIAPSKTRYFLPPYEWYNDTISRWSKSLGLTIFDFTPGTISQADYTTPAMSNYRTSNQIWDNIIEFESQHGMNGFILLIHLGAGPERTDKFYKRLGSLIDYLRSAGYTFVRINELLQ